MTKTNENKTLLKNTLIIAIGSIGAKVMSFLLLPVYTKILTTNEYGNYDYILTVTSFVIPIVTLCMQEAIFRYLIDGNGDSEFQAIISNAFFIQTAGFLILTLITFIISTIFFVEYMFIIVFCVITTGLSSFVLKILRGLGMLKSYSFISFLSNLLLLVTNVISIAFLHMGINGLLCSLILSNIFVVIAVSIKVNILSLISIKSINFKRMKDMLKYSLPLIPNTISTTALALSDRLLIKQFIGSSANGIYSVSSKFPSIIEVVYHYFYLAWCESASRIYKSEQETSNIYYDDLYKAIKRFMFSAVLLLTACMPVLFRILIKGDYKSAFMYVPILMLAIYFNCTGRYLAGIFTAYKHTKQIAISTFISAAVNIFINVLLIPRFGLYVAAISNLVSNYLLVVIRTVMLKKHMLFSSDIKFRISAFIITIAIILLYNYDNWLFIIIGILASTIYFLVINKTLLNVATSYMKKKFKLT